MTYFKIIISLGLIVICAFVFIHRQAVKTALLYPDKPIHIFYESLATQPAFSGMIDMVQLPKDELKLFAWHRFPNRSKTINLKTINAKEIPIHYKEGYVIINAQKFIPVIEKYLERHPKSPVIIYTNMNNYDYFFSQFLPKIDKNRIKRLHLYEDGLGELFSYPLYFQYLAFNEKNIKDLKSYYYDKSKKVSISKYAKYMLHTLFPVTYHFYGLNEAQKNPLYHSFFKEMKGAEFKEIHFKNLAHSLTDEQKNLLFKFVGFDYKYYQEKMKNKKTFMYFTGFHSFNNHAFNHAELTYLKKLIDAYPQYHFFIKPHPSYSALNRTKNIQELFPNVDLITPQIPYEIFIIANLIPSRFSGYASSLFYTLDNEKTDGYFPHPAYMKGLNLLNKFNHSEQLNLDLYVPQTPVFYDFVILKNNQKDYVILQDEKNAYLYLKKKSFKYKKQNNQIFFCSDTHCDSYIKNGNEYNDINVDILKLNHTHWSDFLIHQKDDIYCRLDGDCGKIKKENNKLTICWNNWGCETFYQTSSNDYQFQK